jgi:hypothetical protein
MSEEKDGQNQSEQKKGGNKVLVIGGIVVILGLCTAVGVLASNLSKAKEANEKLEAQQEEPEKGGRTVISSPEEAEQILQDFAAEDSTKAPKYFTVTQNSDWEFPDGNSPSTNAYVENDKENETAIYFDLIVDATGETVYSSPVLELGAFIENFALDTPLQKGEYECTVVYHLVDEDQNTLTTSNVGTKVIVQN